MLCATMLQAFLQVFEIPSEHMPACCDNLGYPLCQEHYGLLKPNQEEQTTHV